MKISYEIGASAEIQSDTNKPNEFEEYLNKNFDLNSLIAFNYIAECLKSVILTVALLERYLPNIETACELSNLEHQHQYDQWGK